ncbi:MAG: FHA domain-containing protein [Coriobacteriales bacterium]|nr:FHA domain-containing protein [Coriobacteriales bacterium]
MFDDMDRCYDCMHPFKKVVLEGLPKIEADAARLASANPSSNARSSEPSQEPSKSDSFTIQFKMRGYPAFKKIVDAQNAALSIGRSVDNDVICPNPKVSRHHAQLSYSNGELWLKDLDSRNMTYLNGVPVLGVHRVPVDSTITICDMSISVARAHP